MKFDYKMKSVDNSCNIFAGYYLYTETSSPRVQGDKATILTPYLNGPQCMKFYYHMYGVDIGSLNIFANNQRIFSKSGDQGNQWVSVKTSIIQSGRYMVSKCKNLKTKIHSTLTFIKMVVVYTHGRI